MTRILLLLLLFLSACAPTRQTAVPPTAAPSSACDIIAGRDWTGPGPGLRLKYDVVYRRDGQDLAMGLLLLLDREAGNVRLVGISEWGMKLLDLVVDSEDVRVLFVLPSLESRSHLAECMGQAVRRIFLLPALPGDGCLEAEGQTRLVRALPGGYLTFDFGPDGLLAARQAHGFGGGWRVDCGTYRSAFGTMLPSRIDYQDPDAGERIIFSLRSE